MEKTLGGGFGSPTWPWYKTASLSDPAFPIEGNWETSARPWIMIAKGELHSLIIAAARRVEAILRDENLLPQDAAVAAATPEAAGQPAGG